MTPQQETVSKLLSKFPNAGALTLAKRAYKENPELFSNIEHARTAVRRAVGSQGVRNRVKRSDKSTYRPPRKAGQGFDAIPDGIKHFEKWGALQVYGACRAILLSDIHIPFHDREALLVALNYAVVNDINMIVLNGDIADFFSVSFWEKDPRQRKFAEELKTVREFLKTLREKFPKVRIIYKVGNHEERLDRYMRVKAPELLDLEALNLDQLIGLTFLGIELVGDKRPIRLGKLNIIHGHEFRFAIAGPVNPARGFFNKAKAHCIGGHLHQSSSHSEKNINGSVISTWSTGCLCDLHPDYAPINQWNHGFAVVDVDDNGAFQVSNLRIVNGIAYL